MAYIHQRGYPTLLNLLQNKVVLQLSANCILKYFINCLVAFRIIIKSLGVKLLQQDEIMWKFKGMSHLKTLN